MNNTTKGVLIGIIIVGLIYYLTRKPSTTNTTVNPPPPPPPPANQEIRIITPSVIPSFSNLVADRNYRYGNGWLRGFNLGSSCPTTLIDTAAGTGTLKGSYGNTCFYLFSSVPSGVVVNPPPHPLPIGERLMQGLGERFGACPSGTIRVGGRCVDITTTGMRVGGEIGSAPINPGFTPGVTPGVTPGIQPVNPTIITTQFPSLREKVNCSDSDGSYICSDCHSKKCPCTCSGGMK